MTLVFRYDFMYRFNAVLISPVPIMACEIVLELRIWILRTKDMVSLCPWSPLTETRGLKNFLSAPTGTGPLLVSSSAVVTV